jgi:hypothetical protein
MRQQQQQHQQQQQQQRIQSSIAANTNSAIFIGSRAGDITGSNCSLHSSGTIIFAERRGRVRWHIRIRCDIEGCQLKEL